ncbi:acyl-CoA thioesterase [Mycobacterium intracellulare]|nr:acyl-CoA thioesterase [Mycobacterium intracellulare]
MVMADTDAAQVIYFGAPLLWAERLVSTWLADVGCGTFDALANGYGLPAVRCEMEYASALRLDDRVQATLSVDTLSERSVTFRSEFTKVGETNPAVIVHVKQVQAAVDGSGLRSVHLLPKLAEALSNTATRT